MLNAKFRSGDWTAQEWAWWVAGKQGDVESVARLVEARIVTPRLSFADLMQFRVPEFVSLANRLLKVMPDLDPTPQFNVEDWTPDRKVTRQ